MQNFNPVLFPIHLTHTLSPLKRINCITIFCVYKQVCVFVFCVCVLTQIQDVNACYECNYTYTVQLHFWKSVLQTYLCVLTWKFTRLFIAALIAISKDQEKISINKTQAKYIMVHPYNVIICVCGGKKGRRNFLYTEMLKWKYFNGYILLCEKKCCKTVCLDANFCVKKEIRLQKWKPTLKK